VDRRVAAGPLTLADLEPALERLRGLMKGTILGARGGREVDAEDALMSAGMVVRILAGWAIEYKVGKAVLEDVGTGALGDDQIQALGAEVSAAIPDDPRLKRRILAELIACYQYALPSGLSKALCDSLEALAEGEVTPLLSPVRTHRKGPAHSRDKLKLSALIHVEVRAGSGMPVNAAEEIVCEAFGITESALHNWRMRLRSANEKLLKSARAIGARTVLQLWDKRLRADAAEYSSHRRQLKRAPGASRSKVPR
jgi:hypothetical protein